MLDMILIIVLISKTPLHMLNCLVLFEDDMLMARNDQIEIESLTLHMSRTFSIKNLGTWKKILGIHIHRDGEDGNP